MMSTHVFSVDVEDYFQVEAFADIVDRSDWNRYPSRVEDNTRRLLDLLEAHEVRATFFILGWVAERFPALVREIVVRGHEPACHSYWHRLIFNLTPEEFRQDTQRAKQAIEQAAGRPVLGYRAPSYSVTSRSLWALEILAQSGFVYDSSIFPIRHDTYGMPSAPRFPFRMDTPSGPISEYPLTTFRLWGPGNLPVAGGGYLRIFPFAYTRLGVTRARQEGLTIVAYIHPWEIDPGQPRLAGRLLSRFRHYTNLAQTPRKLRQLWQCASFTSFERRGLDLPVQQVSAKALGAHA